VSECAVIGLPDTEYGQIIAAIVVLKNPQENTESTLTLDELKKWAAAKLAGYKIPRKLYVEPSIPKNAMGKINKKELERQFSSK